MSFWFIFSANFPVEKSLTASYLLTTKDHLHDAVPYLCESILTAFRKSKEMLWPPTFKKVKQIASEPLSVELECFLCLVFSGKEPEMVQDDKVKHFVYSVGQDICLVVTLGRWELAFW